MTPYPTSSQDSSYGSDPSSLPALDQPYYGIGFVAAVKRVFAKYASFSGRASRSEYWWWALFQFVVLIVLYVSTALFLIAGGETRNPGLSMVGAVLGLILLLFTLATLVPSIGVGVRRLHDAGQSGWLYLVIFVPFVGAIVLVVLMAMPSSPAGAQYDYGGDAPPPPPEGSIEDPYGRR